MPWLMHVIGVRVRGLGGVSIHSALHLRKGSVGRQPLSKGWCTSYFGTEVLGTIVWSWLGLFRPSPGWGVRLRLALGLGLA